MVSFRSVQSRYCLGPREKGSCLPRQLTRWARRAPKAITIPKATSVQQSNFDPGPPPEQHDDDWVPAAVIAERLGHKISLTPYIAMREAFEALNKPVEQPPATSAPRRTRPEFSAVLSFPNRLRPPRS